MKRALSVVAALSLFSSTLALADDGGTPSSRPKNVCVKGGMAHLAAAKGTVLLSRGGSFLEVREGAKLAPGDRILARGGAARVALGANVTVDVSPGSMLNITENEGAICAAQVSSDPAVVGQGQDANILGDPAVLVGGAIGLGVLAASICLAAGCASHHGQQNISLAVLTPVSH